MESRIINRGVSRAQWLEEALLVLRDHSVGDITVKGLAKRLGIAKSGFYWHFKNRDELLDALLDFWIHEFTEVISDNPELNSMEPKKRLITCATMILEHDLTRFELGIRQFALTDKRAAKKIKKANKLRMDFVRQAFADLGFKGAELDMRTRLFVCYQSLEAPMFPELSLRQRKEMITRRLEFLTSDKK